MWHIVALLAALSWFRGNLHTHTAASDGDAPPAEVVRWYRDRGYDFLVLTDHDKITIVDGGGMLLIPGEEVTDKLPKKPLHVNAIGLASVVKPQGGATPVAVLQRNVDAVRKAGGIPLINHPNFGWAFGTAELMQLENVALLEIASGHPLINAQGPPSTEEMWDALLTSGRRWYGVAVDDSHHFVCPPPASSALPGKAWIVVRAEKLTREAVLAALERGEFYASTGVELEDLVVTAKSMTISIREKSANRYRTTFIGAHGRVLAESTKNPATYAFRGDERYVRARIVDSNGRTAWLQPVTMAK
jgi:hypothetical protein